MISGLTPLQEVVARTDHAIVVLVEIRAFPTGCLLDVKAAIRGDRFDDPAHADPVLTYQPDLPDEFLRVGVQYTDGSKATNLERHNFWWHTQGLAPAADRPLLLQEGGRARVGALLDIDMPMWLCPLPPAGRFDFVVEWPAAGIPLTRHPLDGTAIAGAARRARPYWQA
jgi:hypothetical protein